MFKRLYYILLQRAFVLLKRNKSSQGRVLMFHEVSDHGDTYSITKENFAKFLNWLCENRKITDADSMVEELSDKNVLITFDDAFDTVYTNAYPLLKEKNVPFYIFICDEFLGKEGYLNEEMIKEMLTDSKCILGSHSLKHELHRFLKSETASSYLQESRSKLEKIFNRKVESFAFPYGSMYACSNENISAAKEAYEYVFMTYSLNYREEYGNVIPRVNINNTTFKEEMK